jgi:hypothetical protein
MRQPESGNKRIKRAALDHEGRKVVPFDEFIWFFASKDCILFKRFGVH